MIMGGFGIEMLGVLAEALLSFAGILGLIVLFIAGKKSYWWARLVFFLHSFLCISQIDFLVRMIVQPVNWNRIDSILFFAWSVYGSICFFLGIFLFIKEVRGFNVNKKLYIIALIVNATPWIGLFLFG